MNKKRIISSILLVVTIFAIIGIFSLGIFGASDIGKMTIFSDGSGGVGGTHAFIYIENTSSSKMKVGSYNIGAGKTLTLGTWGNKDEHKGIWYNLEAYFISEYDSYSKSVTCKII